MKKYIVPFVLGLFLVSCGETEEQTEKAPDLHNFKLRVSYALGADHAAQLIESGDPNADKYDKEQIIKGFAIGLGMDIEEAATPENEAILEKLIGPSRQEFHAEYNEEGSLCIGKLMGSYFSSGWKKNKAYDQFDIDMVKYGFKQGLYKTDTLIGRAERAEIIQSFVTDVTNKAKAEAMSKEKPFFEKVKAMKGIEALPEGMYLETIKPGNGGKPSPGDDVLVDYILTNMDGDTIESSFEGKKLGREMPAFSLNGVIRGWSLGFPYLKKGGTYRLYVPTELAYGKEPLVFYIELKDFGKPGTLVKGM